MQVHKLWIPDVVLITPDLHTDQRGFLFESFKKNWPYSFLGYDFVQENQSGSTANVLRGLHYQIDNIQGKLIRVTYGAIFDVAVDLRRKSPTFGKYIYAYLSAQSTKQLWVPPGFAHGFLTLSEHAEVLYKITNYQDKASERAIFWNDPDLNIPWPLPMKNDKIIDPILSDKDATAGYFKKADVFDF